MVGLGFEGSKIAREPLFREALSRAQQEGCHGSNGAIYLHEDGEADAAPFSTASLLSISSVKCKADTGRTVWRQDFATVVSLVQPEMVSCTPYISRVE